MSEINDRIKKTKAKCKQSNTNPEANQEAKELMNDLGIQLDGNTDFSLAKRRYYNTDVFCFKSNTQGFDSQLKQKNAVFQQEQDKLKRKSGDAWQFTKAEEGLGHSKDSNWEWCSTSPNVIKETVNYIKTQQQFKTKNGLSQSCDFMTGMPPRMTELKEISSETKPSTSQIESELKQIEKEAEVAIATEKPVLVSTGLALKGVIPNKSTEIFIPLEGLDYNAEQKIRNIINEDTFKSKKDQKVSYVKERYDPDERKNVQDTYVLLKKCYVNGKNGLCAPIGLTDNVKALFEENGINFNIDDLRVIPAAHPFKTDIVLRDYQEKIVKDAREKGKGIIQVATGGGKTIIATQLIADIGQDTLFVVPNNSLFYNAKTQISEHIDPKEVNIGQIGGMKVDYKNDPNKTDINIVSLPLAAMAVDPKGADRIDPEKRKVVLEAMQNADMVVFDETHHMAASTYKKVAQNTPAKYRFGLTATPYRKDNDELEIVGGTGNIFGKITAKQLIDIGKLTPPEIYIVNNSDVVPKSDAEILANIEDPSCNVNEKTAMWNNTKDPNRPHKIPSRYTQEKAQLFRYIEKASVECNNPRNERIIDIVKKLNKYDKTSVVFVSSVEHGYKLQKTLEDQGIYSEILTGESEGEIALSEKESTDQMTRLKKRNALFDRMKKGDLKTIIATDKIMGEGVDIPSIDALVLADMRASKVNAIQVVGRAMRLKEGKKKALIFDFNDPIEYLEDWRQLREEVWTEEQYPIFHTPYTNIDTILKESLGEPVTDINRIKARDKKLIDDRNQQKAYDGMDVGQLKQTAKAKGIPITGLKKREIIGKLMGIPIEEE